MGGKDDTDVDTEQPMPEGFGSSFSDKTIRMRFVRKVYSILLIQLLVTTGIIALIIFTPAIREVYCKSADYETRCQRTDSALIMYIVSYVVFIVSYIAIACCERLRKRSPGNIIAISIFTIALSLLCASIALFHDVWWVIMAMGITSALCLGITLFSFQTKIDFTGFGVYLFAALLVLIMFGFLAIIVFITTGSFAMYTVYTGLIALLFSAFLIYDTQRIMGGKKHSISPEEHIWAAIEIYIDVVYIFLAILGLGGRS